MNPRRVISGAAISVLDFKFHPSDFVARANLWTPVAPRLGHPVEIDPARRSLSATVLHAVLAMIDGQRILAAARDGDAAAVRELLARDRALAGAVDEHRKTPLHLAAEHDHPEVAELLLKAGADIEAWTSWGATPLEWAGVLGSRRTGDILVAHGARLTLAAAAGLGMLDAVRRLSRNGAVSAAFILACRNGHTDVARFLLDRGADVDARGFLAATGLHWAAINGHADTVRFLLEAGADPSVRDARFDADPLGWAREGGHQPVVALLECQRA